MKLQFDSAGYCHPDSAWDVYFSVTKAPTKSDRWAAYYKVQGGWTPLTQHTFAKSPAEAETLCQKFFDDTLKAIAAESRKIRTPHKLSDDPLTEKRILYNLIR